MNGRVFHVAVGALCRLGNTAMKSAVLSVAAFASLALATTASAEDLVFTLNNNTDFTLMEFYASPSDVSNWEEDILGADVLSSGQSVQITIADGRSACDYDLRMVFDDGDVVEDAANLCETGSYTVE
jgi:hypothetical protein